jgi:ribosomal protein S27E
MQEDSRYTLNPKAMVFTIDFCQSFNWEIVDNQLYIAKGRGNKGLETIPKILTTFVSEIQPAIARPLTPQQLQERSPYNSEYRTDLKCPDCSSPLESHDDYLMCPLGDGVLLRGAALLRLHSGQIKISKSLLKNKARPPKTLKCPNCGHDMEEISYNASSLQIHTCTNCPYRWLDSGNLLN